jgi:hypothetical protein
LLQTIDGTFVQKASADDLRLISRLFNDFSSKGWTYLPCLSVGWFITLVLTTSAGVPMVAATKPAAIEAMM